MKSTANSPTLFDDTDSAAAKKPLAASQRPILFDHFYGQEQVFKRFPFLKGETIPSLIIWGPPGSGKTTLAGILANHLERELFTFSAVLGGVNDLKKLIERSREQESYGGKKSVIFIDEIHRFNKAQQDALLPFVENGEILLIGATTEAPTVSVNRALLSRTRIVKLEKLADNAITKIVAKACSDLNLELDKEVVQVISEHSNGDARFALNIVEQLSLIENVTPQLTLDLIFI
jgi:putative ATPase